MAKRRKKSPEQIARDRIAQAEPEQAPRVDPFGPSLTWFPREIGNLTSDESGYGYEYDHDGKLIAIFGDDNGNGKRDGREALFAEYTRDALGRRIVYTDHGSTRGSRTTRYYHDGDNSVVEYDDSGAGMLMRRYFVHGTTYIDERAVVHDFAVKADFYYYLADLYTVEGLVNNRGHEVERYTYDAYGKPKITVIKIEDVDYDGSVDVDDYNLVLAALELDPCVAGPIYDVDGDGFIKKADKTQVLANFGTSLATSPQSSLGNPYLFTGRTLDIIYGHKGTPHILAQDNRNRTYDSQHGRWLQRDPKLYVDGMNLYQYVMSMPTYGVDPDGRQSTTTDKSKACCVYRRTKGWPGGRGRLSPDTTYIFQTEKCSPGAKNAKACCQCPYDKSQKHGTTYGGRYIDKQSICTTRWGPCCLCTVRVVRKNLT